MSEQHAPLVLHKIGEETGRALQQATCSCGWKSRIWYVGDEYVTASYEGHARAVAEGSTVPWMVAPQVPA